jgi:hypothetical protein
MPRTSATTGGGILNNQNVHIQTFLTLLLVALTAASHDFTAKTK